MLKYHKMTEDEKYMVTGWEYPGEYAIYNLEPYDTQKEKRTGLANLKNNLYSFYDGEEFIGYSNLYEEEYEVYFGIGVHPLYCGKGYGTKLICMTMELSQKLFPGKPLYIEVRMWNERAIKCYEKAGFILVGDPILKTTDIGTSLFYHMRAN